MTAVSVAERSRSHTSSLKIYDFGRMHAQSFMQISDTIFRFLLGDNRNSKFSLSKFKIQDENAA